MVASCARRRGARDDTDPGQGANSALVNAAVLVAALRQAPTIEAALAELTHPVARFVRDRMLMPLAQRLASVATNQLVLQEAPATLRAMVGPAPL